MLRYDKLTVKAQEAQQKAQSVAEQYGQQQLQPLHLLSALVSQRDGVVPPLLSRLGVRPEALAQDIDSELGKLPKVTGVAKLFLSDEANQVLEEAFREAEKFKDEFVST